MAYESHRYGSTAAVADGGTITHSLGKIPKLVNLTATTAGTIATATSVTSTTMVVALKQTGILALGMTSAPSQTVYWEVAS